MDDLTISLPRYSNIILCWEFGLFTEWKLSAWGLQAAGEKKKSGRKGIKLGRKPKTWVNTLVFTPKRAVNESEHENLRALTSRFRGYTVDQQNIYRGFTGGLQRFTANQQGIYRDLQAIYRNQQTVYRILQPIYRIQQAFYRDLQPINRI